MIAYADGKGFFELENEITLRDYFAAKAMQAMMTAGFWNWNEPKEDVIRCYKQADAMMEVRNATK